MGNQGRSSQRARSYQWSKEGLNSKRSRAKEGINGPRKEGPPEGRSHGKS